MNIDLQRNNAHATAMCDLAERYGLVFCKNHEHAGLG